MHAPDKALSVNSSKQVVIDTDCELSSQRWYIYYYDGRYHFVNKRYNSDIMGTTYDSNYVSVAKNYDNCCWGLERVLCPATKYPDYDEHADLHHLVCHTPNSGFPYYTCTSCGSRFKSPEEQDYNILSEADRMTVYALLRYSLMLELEGKNNAMEACIRAVDKIRSKYSGYDFSYRNGKYKSPYRFAYSGNNIDMSINISTIKYSEMSIVGPALLWDSNQDLPFPFNIISEDMKTRMKKGEDYSFGDFINIYTEFVKDKISDKVMDFIQSKNIYLYTAITIFNYTKTVINTLESSAIDPGDYAVTITTYSDDFYDTFTGYYRNFSSKINILDERYKWENRSVSGTITNKFYQSYYGTPKDYLHQNKDELIFS